MTGMKVGDITMLTSHEKTLLQQRFTKVVRALARRGWTQAMGPAQPGGVVGCTYGAPGKKRCAIGLMLPPELCGQLTKDFVGGLDGMLTDHHPSAKQAVRQLFGRNARLLLGYEDVVQAYIDLQMSHDEHSDPDGMRRSFQAFAEQYELTFPEGV